MSEDQLKVEVDWCLARLEEKLAAMDPYSRPAQEAAKVHRILKSSKAPVIKKRQAMRNMFGDYREKMKAMEKKNLSAMKKSSLVAAKGAPTESKFLRRSAGAVSGQNSSTSDGTVDSAADNTSQQCSHGGGESAQSLSHAVKSDASQKQSPLASNSAEAFRFGFDGSESVAEAGETSEAGAATGSDSTSKNYFAMKPASEEFRFNFTENGCEET